MYNLVLKRGFEEEVRSELLSSLTEAKKRGWRVILLQDSRYKKLDFFDFDIVIDDTSPEKDFANFHNRVYLNIPHGEWVLFLDFDEYFSIDFFDKVPKYVSSKKYTSYDIPRVNVIIPQDKTAEVCKLYGWFKVDVMTKEMGLVKAVNFPDFQSRLHRSGFGKWYGKVHERFIPKNAFAHSKIPFEVGYILHVKTYLKQIEDNRRWETYQK